MLCYKCGLRNFQELAYQFRRDIPRDQLPGVLKVSFNFWLLGMMAGIITTNIMIIGDNKSD